MNKIRTKNLKFHYLLLLILSFKFITLSANEATSKRIPMLKSISVLDNTSSVGPKSTWQPNSEQVSESTSISLDFLKKEKSEIHKRIQDYHAQVLGIGELKLKKIHLNYHCTGQKSDTYYIALDGGDCFFRLELDLINKKVISYNQNGHA